MFNTVVATVIMLIAGYVGETGGNYELMGHRGLWGFISTVPFAYIVWVLWNEVTIAMAGKEGNVKVLFRNIRLLLLFTHNGKPISNLLRLNIAYISVVVTDE